jgi:hypothetical protein
MKIKFPTYFKVIYVLWTCLSLPLHELQTQHLLPLMNGHCYHTGDVYLLELLAGRTERGGKIKILNYMTYTIK